jgi:hypothetical protein
MRKIDEIIVHCSATRPEWMAGEAAPSKIDEIRGWHKARGFDDIGYHWIIDRDGSVLEGRQERRIGAHVKNRNASTIGICLIGGFGSSANDQFADHFTPEQDAALRALVRNILDRHPSVKKVSGHNDYDAGKACPGFRVSRWAEGKGERKVVESRSMIGQAAAAAGTVGAAAVETLAPVLSDAAQTIEPMIQWSPTLKAVFITLTLAGIALTVYARWDDWKRGRK